nr:PTS sugar transporter subunit IIB [Oceanobacillus arenosus]
MEKTKILLVCSAGMSTSLLMTNMEEAAKEKGTEVEIQAMSSTAANKYLAKENVDILLLGPQVRFMKAKYEKKLANTDTVLDVIDMQDYGKVDGAKVLESALQLKQESL